MQHEGSFHLDDVRHLQDDEALRTVLGFNKLPSATTLGSWLRRMSRQPQIRDSWVKVNQSLLQSALHCKKVTLDIDATEVIASKTSAQWTYNKNKGFMPMVGQKPDRLSPLIFARVMSRQPKIIWPLSNSASSRYHQAAL